MEPVARTSDVMVRGQETRARGINENLRGQVTDVRDSASIAREQAELDKATTITGALSLGAFADKVSNQYSAATLAPTPDAERQNREAIVDSNAVGRDAAQILGTINYDAAQRRTVTGQAAIGAAATMIAEVAEIPEPLAAAIVESPASVEAQIDNQPIEVQAAVASLPLEATISGQKRGPNEKAWKAKVDCAHRANKTIAKPASKAAPTFNCCNPSKTSSPKPLVPIIEAITTIANAIIVH